MRDYADYFPRYANQHVPLCNYIAELDGATADARMVLQKPGYAAIGGLDADGILATVSIAAALTSTEFADTYNPNVMGRYGRNVTMVASGASTATVEVRGLDYLGQPMVEQFTLNGTTSVGGKKAFKYITSVKNTSNTAATTVNVGWGNALGLPYATQRLIAEFVDGAAPTAGTLVAADTAEPTATTGDPRGTYTPHSSVIPNSSRTYALNAFLLDGNLHGNEHFYSEG